MVIPKGWMPIWGWDFSTLSYLLAAMYLLVQNPIGSDLATPTRERKGLDVDPASIQP